MKNRESNFQKCGDIIPEEFTIIGWGFPEPDINSDGRTITIPCLEWNDERNSDDVSQEEEDFLHDVMIGDKQMHCNHCGKRIKYFGVCRNDITGAVHLFGTTCAGDMNRYDQSIVDGMHDKSLRARKRIKRAQEKAKRREEAQKQLDEHDGLERALKVDHHIITDLRSKLWKYGSLSEAQIKLAFKIERDEAERARKRAEIEKEKAQSSYFGKVGERIKELPVEVVFNTSFEGMFGTVCIAKFKDVNGNTFTYKGSAYWGRGYRALVSFTIKEHTEYKGEKQTVISRIHEHDNLLTEKEHRDLSYHGKMPEGTLIDSFNRLQKA